MISSVWRYSHFLLAVSSFIFVLIASLTGIILAFEPISSQLQSNGVKISEDISVAHLVSVLEETYDEVVWVEIDADNFVKASVVITSGESGTFYIHPKTGEKTGEIVDKAKIFKFATNLHRSLFLKKTGRFLVGLSSFLLFLIAVSGVMLIIKRQGGVKGFFGKIVREDVYSYFHVIFGRWGLIPIIIVTLTGVYLSLEKFSLLPKDQSKHQINFEDIPSEPKLQFSEFSIFQSINLDDFKRLEFPFSDDAEDYFQLELKDKQLLIHQFTGQILSEKTYPIPKLLSYYSLLLHTGQGNILWSIVLLLSSCAILYFIYSGFQMVLQRKKKSPLPENKYSKDEAEYIILVGSETKNTYANASALFDGFINAELPVFISELNNYEVYSKAKHLIVLTSTYGKGEAPTNAKQFLDKVNTIQQNKTLRFSVVGFGSLAYPDYCQFAITVDEVLSSNKQFDQVEPLHKINNQSFDAFKIWLDAWTEKTGLLIEITKPVKRKSAKNYKTFKVMARTELNIDDTFLLELQPQKKIKFTSGDLLSIISESDGIERLYSVAKMNNNVLLSIKKHAFGVCSSYLSKLSENDTIKAKLKRHFEFHFPAYANSVVLISNGTGIAPFLGMIANNVEHKDIHLFWGGRTTASYNLYKSYIDDALSKKQLKSVHIAYSQEQDQKIYVQDKVKEQAQLIAETFQNEGAVMICGSVAMQSEVLEVLEIICKDKLHQPLSVFENNEQLKMDCY